MLLGRGSLRSILSGGPAMLATPSYGSSFGVVSLSPSVPCLQGTSLGVPGRKIVGCAANGLGPLSPDNHVALVPDAEKKAVQYLVPRVVILSMVGQREGRTRRTDSRKDNAVRLC